MAASITYGGREVMKQVKRGESQEKIRQIDKQIADLSAQNLVVARLHTNGVYSSKSFRASRSWIMPS